MAEKYMGNYGNWGYNPYISAVMGPYGPNMELWGPYKWPKLNE